MLKIVNMTFDYIYNNETGEQKLIRSKMIDNFSELKKEFADNEFSVIAKFPIKGTVFKLGGLQYRISYSNPNDGQFTAILDKLEKE